MAIIITEIKQSLENGDDFVMPADDWLKLAVNTDKEQLATIHGDEASDGFRIHQATDRDSLFECWRSDWHEKIRKMLEQSKRDNTLHIAIDRQYLIEALAGINSEDTDMIQIWINPANKIAPILVCNKMRNALIMPMHNPE
jgi:hypothetical protein